MSATEIRNGGNIIMVNSPVAMLNFVYKYKFWGLPKGVSIPPKFAAMFCIIKVNAIYFCLPVVDKTRYPRGRNVSNAISFAINIEPIKVTYASANTHERADLNNNTIFCANTKKKRIFLNAHTTASTQNRQVSVLKSK